MIVFRKSPCYNGRERRRKKGGAAVNLHINRVAMTRQHYTIGRAGQRIRVLVLHATAGSHPGDYEDLRRGGSTQRPVSAHYYIAPNGAITQFVNDTDTAWHAGASAWRGLETPVGEDITTLNYCSLGIELSHSNRPNVPHPPAQIAAAVALSRMLVSRYQIERANLVRHLDISPRRKTDPAALNWPAFVAAVYGPEPEPSPGTRYTDASELIGDPPNIRPDVVAIRIAARAIPGGSTYTAADIAHIVDAYWRIAAAGRVDPLLAVAQMVHETGWLTSFWCQRPRRNPAGIGVTGETRTDTPNDVTGWAYNDRLARWERGVSFASWAAHAIPAHIGRILAYALPPGVGSDAQRAMIEAALAVRSLPIACRGSAPTLRALGRAHNPAARAECGWAVPGEQYGARIAAIATLLLEGR